MEHFDRINRIRLEFKAAPMTSSFVTLDVLIESDWNLKGIDRYICHECLSVLIESDWNLKSIIRSSPTLAAGINRIRLEFKACSTRVNGSTADVLIESDWNLKEILPASSLILPARINRIRLEFKGQQISFQSSYT